MLEWKSWCRLCGCGGINEFDIFLKDMQFNTTIADDLKRLCNLQLDNTMDLPSKICKDCKINIKNLKNFLLSSIKTQQMFAELKYCQTSDVINLREKYKLNNIEIKEEQDIFSALESVYSYESKENVSAIHKIEENDMLLADILNKSDTNQKTRPKQSIDENLILDNNSEFSNSSKEDQEGGMDCLFLERNEDLKNFEKIEDTSSLTKIKVEKIENNKTQKNAKSNKKPKVKLPKDRKKSYVKYQCKECDKYFSNQGGLTTHLKISHSISKTPYTCKFCGKSFERRQRLENHENAHLPSDKRKLLSCPHCDKKFNSESGRWSHIHTVHDKEKAVICEECGKEFSTKHHLGRHKISHSQEKNFQCPNCPARFKAKGGLAAHMQVHGESYPCLTCGVLLKTKQLLKNHMVVHSDVKNYRCNFCKKDFKRLNDLNYHLITHIGIKPYECRVCNQKFVHDMTYRRHLKSTHPTQFAEMIAKGERISCRNFPPPEQLKAINEAAKHTHDYEDDFKKENN